MSVLGNVPAPSTPEDDPSATPAATHEPVAAQPPAPGSPPIRWRERFPRLIATVGGLGYIPVAPGTFGALAGVALWAVIQSRYAPDLRAEFPLIVPTIAARAHWALFWLLPATLLVAVVGVWASRRVAAAADAKDPQYVVVDETSGQMLGYCLALAPLNWKYLILGFILFRAFDIWKPFPARQLESLPGGWGIMADDWAAGIYAALGLWIARLAGM